MNPRAAEELMSIVMLEDFVARRDAVNNWSRRWVATVRLSHPASKDVIKIFEEKFGGKADEAARYALSDLLVRGFVEDKSVAALRWERDETDKSITTTVEMNVILQEPKELTWPTHH